ncbi:MAG: sulfite exporter TauE/SafE family protein [bacterium]|nr:sulfite exporter TauE/SafE family protein [bacterium]
MELWLIAVFVATGALAGTLAGLMGIGGGILYVPVLVYSLEQAGLPDAQIPLVAVSTSLAVILASLGNSLAAHWKNGNIDFSPLLGLVLGGALGALLASLALKELSADPFKILLGSFELFMALKLLKGSQKNDAVTQGRRGLLVFAGIGFAGGLLSAFFGVGGGLIVMPLLHFVSAYPIAKAVGTTTGFMLFAAAAALGSHGLQADPSTQLTGLWHAFYLPGFFALLPSAFIFNRVGANLAHRTDPKRLKRWFGWFILPLGLLNGLGGLWAWLG